ncbi:chromosome partitioning protein ParB [Oryzomicrobium terrae]|uniref:Chromosome partitioning protein ParB n=1 Tax=Oryzomicrobium terrae TaxID=1735038 RepID=A0A5C1E512_9RHOO|nr:ParB/RepB/Spo0J family partition protein [Oryzomicrobium terrae]QEL63619.1 chromosome partitioning protein ParB [Oryzomicrobium terrae]
MAFKDTHPDFKLIDLALIDPDPEHPRKQVDTAGLKALVASIQAKGLIQPLIVQPAGADGRHKLIVGERRWRAAMLAGETKVPALVRPCAPEEALEIQVFENLGQGVRAPLETREMANAIQAIAQRFDSREAAAEHFGRPQSWLNQATAAANLSPKVSALLDSGKISSTTTAIQLEKLAQKNEARVDTLIEQVQDGEKLPKQAVESALTAEGLKRSKKKATADAVVPSAAAPASEAPAPSVAPPPAPAGAATTAPAPATVAAPAPRKVSPSKMKRVAQLLGVAEGDEDEVLARLIDEFLALKGENNPPF